jgi:hypothetical protein
MTVFGATSTPPSLCPHSPRADSLRRWVPTAALDLLTLDLIALPTNLISRAFNSSRTWSPNARKPAASSVRWTSSSLTGCLTRYHQSPNGAESLCIHDEVVQYPAHARRLPRGPGDLSALGPRVHFAAQRHLAAVRSYLDIPGIRLSIADQRLMMRPMTSPRTTGGVTVISLSSDLTPTRYRTAFSAACR